MGFWEDTKEKVKDIFGGGDDKDTSGGGTSDEQKMSKAPSSGEGDSWSERVEERGERAKERAEEKLGIDDGTSGGGSSRSGGGSSRSGGGSSGDGSFAERMEEKGKRAKQRAKEKLGIEKESGQKTTQTQAQQLRQKFQEEDVLGGRMSQQEGFSPRMTTQRTPKEFQISQQRRQRIRETPVSQPYIKRTKTGEFRGTPTYKYEYVDPTIQGKAKTRPATKAEMEQYKRQTGAKDLQASTGTMGVGERLGQTE